MNQKQSSPKKKGLLLKAVLSLAVAAFIYSTFAFTNRMHAPSTSYSGEELFSGIVFGKGDVANKISGLTNLAEKSRLFSQDPKQNQVNQESENQIVAAVKMTYPGYFDEFKKDMYSHNPVLIKNTLATMHSVVEKSMLVYALDLASKKPELAGRVANHSAEYKMLVEQIKTGSVDENYLISNIGKIFGLDIAKQLRFYSTGSGTAAYFNSTCIVALVLLAAVLIVNVAGIVNVAAVVNLSYVATDSMVQYNDKNRLAFEKLSYSIATEL